MSPLLESATAAVLGSAPLPGGDWGYLANMGGPRSRTRTERLRSTLLGRTDGAIRCPPVLRVAIDFGGRDPRACVLGWLQACGYGDEEMARAAMDLPPGPCICRPDPSLPAVAHATLDPVQGLRLAIVLGLCTPWLYDPGRPVLWTTTSLTRRLELFEGRGFYA